MNWKKDYITSVMLKGKFKEHNLIKQDILNLIKSTPSESTKIHDDYYKDNITSHDFGLGHDLDRPWVKLFMQYFTNYWGETANELGFEKLKINKVWFQRYGLGSYHNWHTHASNYTGVYYLELPNKSAFTEFLDPKDNKTSFFHKAKEGDIIFFPCHLIHRGCEQPINESKTIISWNLDFLTIKKGLLKK